MGMTFGRLELLPGIYSAEPEGGKVLLVEKAKDGRYVTWFRKVGDLPHVTNLKAKLETRSPIGLNIAVDVRHNRFPLSPAGHPRMPCSQQPVAKGICR